MTLATLQFSGVPFLATSLNWSKTSWGYSLTKSLIKIKGRPSFPKHFLFLTFFSARSSSCFENTSGFKGYFGGSTCNGLTSSFANQLTLLLKNSAKMFANLCSSAMISESSIREMSCFWFFPNILFTMDQKHLVLDDVAFNCVALLMDLFHFLSYCSCLEFISHVLLWVSSSLYLRKSLSLFFFHFSTLVSSTWLEMSLVLTILKGASLLSAISSIHLVFDFQSWVDNVWNLW